jgi:isopentenyldiphosphate isomerase
MWIARRARTKTTYPGMLDNFVAGGQPIGIGLHQNVVKECAEEAGVPPELAARAVPVGAISYCFETDDGLKPDVQFVYDLELPPAFEPVNRDGEIEAFHLWPVADVIALTRDTRDFKFNCNLVNIDFFVRHGLLAPDDEPDYLDIVAGLHR